MLTRLRVILGVLGVIALFVAIALALTSKRPSTAVRSIVVAATTSINAADSYLEAVKSFDALRRSGSDTTLLSRYEDGGDFDAGADQFFVRHAGILQLVRAGAAMPVCEWGEPDLQARLKPLNGLRGLARLTIVHARYARQRQHDPAAALEELLAAMALARHIGVEPLLVDKLVELATVSQAIDSLAQLIPELPAPVLSSLPQKLDALPESATGQQMMQGEFDHARRSIRSQEGGFVLRQMVEALEGFYRNLGAVIDSQSPAEFAKSVDAEMAKYSLNTFAQTAGASLKRSREPMAVVQAKLAMLYAAVRIQSEGESAVASSRDPFGDGAPFAYTKTPTGFELSSRLITDKGPAKLRVGGDER